MGKAHHYSRWSRGTVCTNFTEPLKVTRAKRKAVKEARAIERNNRPQTTFRMLRNEELNKLTQYRKYRCAHCRRKYPETILDLESLPNYKAPAYCINKKSCDKHKQTNSSKYKITKRKRVKHL